MTDVTVTESATYPGENYIKSFFSDLPTDYRFSQVAYKEFEPATPIATNSKTVDFILSDCRSPNVYILQDTLMSVTVVIKKANKTSLPDTEAIVGPVNCALSSIFSSCDMKVNDISITKGADNFAYRNYLSQLLTFGEDCKTTVQYMSGNSKLIKFL